MDRGALLIHLTPVELTLVERGQGEKVVGPVRAPTGPAMLGVEASAEGSARR